MIALRRPPLGACPRRRADTKQLQCYCIDDQQANSHTVKTVKKARLLHCHGVQLAKPAPYRPLLAQRFLINTRSRKNRTSQCTTRNTTNLNDGSDPVDVLLQSQEPPQEQVLEGLEGLRVHSAHDLNVLPRQLEGRALEVDVEARGVCARRMKTATLLRAIHGEQWKK